MKDYYTDWRMDKDRPEETIKALVYCLDALVKSDKVAFEDEIVANLTYEEVIGALLCGYDLAMEHDQDVLWREGAFDL
jgi:hypothetical protein